MSLASLGCSKNQGSNRPIRPTVNSNEPIPTFAVTAPILPATYAAQLGKGFDVTFAEFTKYAADYDEKMLRDFKEAGFTNVRIRTNEPTPDAKYLQSLKTQIAHCLKYGIKPIVAYQGFYLEESAKSEADANQHLVTWWKNMARELRDFPPELSFNVLIEISGTLKQDYAAMNRIYKDVLAAIRESNPTRIVIFPPVNISNPDYLQHLQIPGAPNDKFTMAEWHFYAAGPTNDPTNKKYWKDGSTLVERTNITGPIKTATDWSNKTGYATWVGAWMAGNYNKGQEFTIPEQVAFASYMTRQLAKAKLPWSINADNKFYDYRNKQWYTENPDGAGMAVRDALLDPDTLAIYKAAKYAGGAVRVAPGKYDAADLARLQLGAFGSIMVPFDVEVRVWPEAGFAGAMKVLKSTTPDTADMRIKSMEVVFLNQY
jgi:hypothetical protein